MRGHELTDAQWSRIENLLPERPGQHGGVAKDNRNFVNAVWCVANTGIALHRFNEWCKKGVWKRVSDAVQDPDLEWLLLDSTVIRAHPHAAGMNNAQNDQALGYSRGGFETKLHLSVWTPSVIPLAWI